MELHMALINNYKKRYERLWRFYEGLERMARIRQQIDPSSPYKDHPNQSLYESRAGWCLEGGGWLPQGDRKGRRGRSWSQVVRAHNQLKEETKENARDPKIENRKT